MDETLEKSMLTLQPIPQGAEKRLPDVREKDIRKACEMAIELQAKSTRVNGWYAHTHGDHRADGMKTVRGPFCRWFALMEGADPDREGKSQGCLADPAADIEYASFALNNVASIAMALLSQALPPAASGAPMPEGFPPRVWLQEWPTNHSKTCGVHCLQSPNPFWSLEYLSLAEHTALLSSARAEARREAFEEAISELKKATWSVGWSTFQYLETKELAARQSAKGEA